MNFRTTVSFLTLCTVSLRLALGFSRTSPSRTSFLVSPATGTRCTFRRHHHVSFSRRHASTNGDSSTSSTTSSTAMDGPASATYFDTDDFFLDGENCLLHDDGDFDDGCYFAAEREGELSQQFWATTHEVVRWIPVVNPVLAFFSYEELARLVDTVTQLLSDNTWVAVDGGTYQAKIIAPAINGVIVPAISILFATLISNTVSILRQRLLDIRTNINLEAGDLRYLQTMIDSFPPGEDQTKCRSYLIQYVSRLIAESQPGVKVNALEPTGMDSEMNGMLSQLNRCGCDVSSNISPSLLSETYGAVTRLSTHRSRRISALQATFPALHYMIVSALALSICVAFLMETNQELLIFLNSIQLRILWTMLIGTFSALGVVCYDLGSDPFGGSHQVNKSVNQLFTIRSALIASAVMPMPPEKKSREK